MLTLFPSLSLSSSSGFNMSSKGLGSGVSASHLYVCLQRLEARVALLQSSVDEFYKAKNEFAAKATEEEMRLLRFQRKLEEEKGEPLVGFSLHDTITALLSVGLHKHAEQLYKDFRVSDKRLTALPVGFFFISIVRSIPFFLKLKR